MPEPRIADVLSDNYETLYRRCEKALMDRARLRGMLGGIMERIRHPVYDDTLDAYDADMIEKLLAETE